MNKIVFSLVAGCLALSALAQQKVKGFQIIEKPEQKEVAILYNGQLLTAYAYYDSSRKPVLYPVNTVDGITVTRGYPFQAMPGERTDHPHHTGIWFNYESVNGLDFWNNSTAIAPGKRHLYGTIKHQDIMSKKAGPTKATLVTSSVWVTPNEKPLLIEVTTFTFSVQGNSFIIDRKANLTATDTTVIFKDVKDGVAAIRVARELEMPSKDATNFVDDKGNVTTVAKTSNEGVTGMYYGSTGLQGDSVWSSKGPWVMLTGKKQGKDITVAIIDHPSNVGYPAYWHARGYGLFAVNPLGRKVFSNGKEELNFTLQKGESKTLQYRFVIHTGNKLTSEEVNQMANSFAQQK